MRTLEGDVETQHDFAQAMIDGGVADWLLDTTPELPAPPDSDTVAESTGPARDPSTGRFVPQGTEDSAEEEVPADTGIEDSAEPVAEEATDETPEDGDHGELEFELDPEVLTVLDKYDGDLNKALKALSESQSMIGRQGGEVGELRQQIQALQDLIQSQPQVDPRMYAPYQNDIDEDPQSLVQEVLDRTVQTGNFDEATYEAAIAAWGQDDPFGAARMDARISMIRQAVEQGMADPTGAPIFGQEPQQGPSIEAAMAEVVQRHPDVEQHLPTLGEVARQFPTLRGLMETGTPSQKAQAFEELLVIAKSRSMTDTSKDAMRKVVLRTQEEVRKEKADAAVLSASRRTAATPEQSPKDVWLREFNRATGQSLEDE